MTTHDDLTHVETAAEDEGCTVDWSWLSGLEIEAATSDLQRLRIRFKNGQTLTVQATTYQGRAFLAFDPWKPPSTPPGS
jgi:hypothetical protein